MRIANLWGNSMGNIIIRGFRGVISTNRWQKAKDGLVAYPAMSVGSVIFARQGDMDEKMKDKDNKKWILEMD
jgi:hypothetical protein